MVVIAIAIAMAAVFATSYSLVLGRATPHRITIGLVGNPAEQPALLAALKRATHGGLALYPYAADAAAEEAIDDQAIYAALVLDQAIPRVLVSSASGYSVARALEMAAEQLELETGLRLYIVDLHPLPPTDPQGLVSFYVTLASSILGFVTMFQLRANAPGLKFRDWPAAIAVLAIAGGLVLAVVVDPLIGALHGPFPELWLALAAEVAVAALLCSTMLVLVGRWAIIPTWTLFVILGNTSSGGAVAQPLLPPFYAFIGRFLPPVPPSASSAPPCTSAAISTLGRSSSRRSGSSVLSPRCSSPPGGSAGDRRSEATWATVLLRPSAAGRGRDTPRAVRRSRRTIP